MKSLVKHALASVLPASTYTSLNARVAARDIANGKRDEPEFALLEKYVRACDTVLDIGANQGVFAYKLSRLVGPSGKVHAFEPIPNNLAILSTVVKRLNLSNVVIHPVACGEQERMLAFVVPTDGRLLLGPWAHRKTAIDDGGVTYSCPMVRIDDVISEPVSFIKCDIEGAELFAFQGAERLISTYHPIVLVEVEPKWLLRYGLSFGNVTSFFTDRGYTHKRTDSESNNYLFIYR